MVSLAVKIAILFYTIQNPFQVSDGKQSAHRIIAGERGYFSRHCRNVIHTKGNVYPVFDIAFHNLCHINIAVVMAGSLGSGAVYLFRVGRGGGKDDLCAGFPKLLKDSL